MNNWVYAKNICIGDTIRDNALGETRVLAGRYWPNSVLLKCDKGELLSSTEAKIELIVPVGQRSV